MRKKVSIYLNEKERKELKVLSASLGYSMSNFINIAIKEKIKKILNNKESIT